MGVVAGTWLTYNILTLELRAPGRMPRSTSGNSLTFGSVGLNQSDGGLTRYKLVL